MASIDLKNYQSSTTKSTKARRIAWYFVSFLFFYSPRPLFSFRRFLLRLFGAKMGVRSYVYPSTRIWDPAQLEMGSNSSMAEFVDCYNIVKITIGSNCTVSQYAYLCTGNHDITLSNMPLKAEPITIMDGAWICARAFIGPGVTVHEAAVVAACAVAVKDVQPWTIVGGNPCKFLGDRKLKEEV